MGRTVRQSSTCLRFMFIEMPTSDAMSLCISRWFGEWCQLMIICLNVVNVFQTFKNQNSPCTFHSWYQKTESQCLLIIKEQLRIWFCLNLTAVNYCIISKLEMLTDARLFWICCLGDVLLHWSSSYTPACKHSVIISSLHGPTESWSGKQLLIFVIIYQPGHFYLT